MYVLVHYAHIIMRARASDFEGVTSSVAALCVQRRFDRVKGSTNLDHVRHRKCIAFVFTTVPRDFRLFDKFSEFI